MFSYVIINNRRLRVRKSPAMLEIKMFLHLENIISGKFGIKFLGNPMPQMMRILHDYSVFVVLLF